MPPPDPATAARILLDRTVNQAGAAEAECLTEIQRCAAAGDQAGADHWDAVLIEIAAIRATRPHPIVPLDIWRTAKLLLDQMGERAPLYASQRISELARANDAAGQAVWADIRAALAELMRPGAGAQVH